MYDPSEWPSLSEALQNTKMKKSQSEVNPNKQVSSNNVSSDKQPVMANAWNPSEWPSLSEALQNTKMKKSQSEVNPNKQASSNNVSSNKHPVMANPWNQVNKGNQFHILYQQCNELQSSGTKDLSTYPNLESNEVHSLSKVIHPAFLSHWKPVKTSGDHNCLYNAICLCLGLSENMQENIRHRTVQCIIRHSEHFRQLLANAIDVTLDSLIEQCRKSDRDSGWGNMFHILAIAIMLKRSIYVYSSFTNKKGTFLQRKNMNIITMAKLFQDKAEHTRQHQNYEPQDGIIFKEPLCLYYNGDHFTALIPRVSQPIYCVPSMTNLPSITNNDIPNNIEYKQVPKVCNIQYIKYYLHEQS